MVNNNLGLLFVAAGAAIGIATFLKFGGKEPDGSPTEPDPEGNNEPFVPNPVPPGNIVDLRPVIPVMVVHTIDRPGKWANIPAAHQGGTIIDLTGDPMFVEIICAQTIQNFGASPGRIGIYVSVGFSRILALGGVPFLEYSTDGGSHVVRNNLPGFISINAQSAIQTVPPSDTAVALVKLLLPGPGTTPEMKAWWDAVPSFEAFDIRMGTMEMDPATDLATGILDDHLFPSAFLVN